MISGACIQAHIVLIAAGNTVNGCAGRETADWQVLLNIQEILPSQPISGALEVKRNIVFGSVY